MVCLETTFIIDLLRGRENIRKIKDGIDKGSDSISIASPTIIEIKKGLILTNASEEEKDKAEKLINSLIVLNLDKDSASLSGEIEAGLIKKGDIIDLEDIMISGICIINNEKLITRNKKHFERIKNLEIETY